MLRVVTSTAASSSPSSNAPSISPSLLPAGLPPGLSISSASGSLVDKLPSAEAVALGDLSSSGGGGSTGSGALPVNKGDLQVVILD